jgi:signal transduction histidine kinase
MKPKIFHPSQPRPSVALSVAIFIVVASAMAFLRFHVFPDRFVMLTSGLFMLICLWHRDRVLLWCMGSAFAAMGAYKAFLLLPIVNPDIPYTALQWAMQVINIAVIGTAVHIILNLTDRLRASNLSLTEANADLTAREEEISRQNEELQAQTEELAQQNEEIQAQSEELAQQNEELQGQAEEMQAQSEELQIANTELSQREAMLQMLLESLSTAESDRPVLQRICATLLELLQGEAVGAAILERIDGEMVLRAYEGSCELSKDRWPFSNSFGGLVIEHGRTAFVEDLQTRPDLVLPQPKERPFRSVLASPLHMDGDAAGAVEVYALTPHAWTTKQFRIMEWVAGQCSILLEAQRLREQMARTNARLDRLVQDRTAKLQEMVEELEHFSYTITHDMRAPLRAMQGFAALLEAECNDLPNAQCLDFLRRITTSASRMDRLIVDALSYSKAVRQEMTLTPVDPEKLLRGMIESYPGFQTPQARIELEGSLPLILANEAGLTQCFSNLLNNAVKFVPPGRQPRVRVTAERSERRVRLWFEDNGIGIPPEMVPRLFSMFQRASKEYEGTGIGLALVRKVTERMGGKIGVESTPGNGSRFWLELNAAQ